MGTGIEVAVIGGIVGSAAADVVAGEIGSTILGSTVLADAATGAISGAIGSGTAAAVTGGDVGKALGKGALAGGLGAVAGDLAGEAAKDAGASSDVTRAASGAARAGTQAAVRGGSLQDILASAAGGGAAGYFVEPAGADADFLQRFGTGLAEQIVGGSVSGLLKPEKSSGQQSTLPYTSPSVVPTASPVSTVGSAALAQALRTDPGAALFGATGKEDEKKRRSPWNIASLRIKDETGG